MITPDLLKRTRKAANDLTQEEFAKKLLISGDHYQRIEAHGRKIKDPAHMVRKSVEVLREHIGYCNKLMLEWAAIKIDDSTRLSESQK